MREDEIVKALERMSEEDPDGFSSDVLGVINRLKAENERLKGPSRAYPFCNLLGGCLVFSKSLKDYNDMRKGIESEARKEFAERLKKVMVAINKDKNGYCEYRTEDCEIDKLLEEMEGLECETD